jgi:hypothetical protein
MKNILVFLLICLIFIPITANSSTSSIPFVHNKIFGTWKKQIGSKPDEPLYISFIRNYGLPDAQGTFFDSAKIAVLEPPKEYANYESLLDFMTPKEFNGDKEKIRMENDPLTFYEIKLGGAKGKAIRGTGRLIYIDNTYPVTNMLAKGYFFSTEKGILEVLVQIRSVKGDLGKIEQDVDELVDSFRFGLEGDIALMELIKTYKPGKPVEQAEKVSQFSYQYLIYGGSGLLLILILVFFVLKKHRPKNKGKTKKRPKKSENYNYQRK